MYSSEVLMTFIRITGSQFGSEFNQCIPGEMPMHFIKITGIWEWALPVYSIEIPMNLIRITGSQFGSEYYPYFPLKFHSPEINLGVIPVKLQWHQNHWKSIWVRCCTWLYQFLIFAFFLRVSMTSVFQWKSIWEWILPVYSSEIPMEVNLVAKTTSVFHHQNHRKSICALMILSALQLTSKQWIIIEQFTARADLFLKYSQDHH